jgi:hypothetical protein
MSDTVEDLRAANRRLTDSLLEARDIIKQMRDELVDRDLPRIALHYAVASHGEAPGKDSDACFTARASHFLEWLRNEQSEPS